MKCSTLYQMGRASSRGRLAVREWLRCRTVRGEKESQLPVVWRHKWSCSVIFGRIQLAGLDSYYCRYTTLRGSENRITTLKPDCSKASSVSGWGEINAVSRACCLRSSSLQNCSG